MAKAWTVVVWMAGDNDLESFALGDLKELKRVGSGPAVDVVVQLDRMSDDRTRRYHVRPRTPLEDDVLEDLGETNTGDPAVAADFFTWAMRKFPAERSALVLWNHGSGIDERDVYRRAARRGVAVTRGRAASARTVPRSRVRAVVSRRTRRALFATTVATAIGRRAIAYDDTARDFLDNEELKKVLAGVKARTGRRIDLLGFDACLMSMLEIAYQLRGTADVIVGSEELEPGDGWPYDQIVGALAKRPALTAREVGALVVQRYVASYRGDDVTLSALDLTRVDAAAKTVDALAAALVKAIRTPAEYQAVSRALFGAQHYDTKDFIDLHDFCAQLATRTKSAAVKTAARATIAAISGGSGLVHASRHKGTSVARSHGVAIYFPRGDASVAYDRLDFARATRWDSFIRAFTRS